MAIEVGYQHHHRHWWYRRYEKHEVVTEGELTAFLVTVARSGVIKLWRRGIEVGSWNTGWSSGMPQELKDHLIVGGGASGLCMPGWCGDHHGFEGEILDVRIWDRIATWEEAVAGTPKGSEPENPDPSHNADMPASCISSTLNTWDFVCDDTVPPELAKAFGFDRVGDPMAMERFKKKEEQGEVTNCGITTRVKSAVFHGKFGDGLTGEYFKMRTGHNCHWPPFIFGQEPALVRVDPTINFNPVDFFAPFNEYAVRWTGKVLISMGGTYQFKLRSKDGSWLSVAGRMVVDNSRCHGAQDRTGSVVLTKGAHRIAVLYFNRGPKGKNSGTISLQYNGPDTSSQWTLMPQERLGSAPMRLSKVAGDQGSEEEDKTTAPGVMVYDEKKHLAVMPIGSCDFQCQKGMRKGGAAPFHFMCTGRTEVSFVAGVDSKSERAFMWLDKRPVTTWNLQSPSLIDASTDDTVAEEDILALAQAAAAANETAAVLLSTGDYQPRDFVVDSSAPSPKFNVAAGEHVLLIQGRPKIDAAFAMRDIRFEDGRDKCTFYIVGKDKLPDDC